MYHIYVLILCFLRVTAFVEIVTLSNDISTTTDSNTTTTIQMQCRDDDDCETLPHLYVCINSTCYDCYKCCANKEEHCQRIKCACTWFLTDEELKVVAQAVLGVAVFVTCVALVSLLWKVCARRLRRRRAAAAGADLLDDTMSLSSQQVFIVERLRNRPPRYEEAAHDFVVEKPPPYSEVVVEAAQPARSRSVLVGGVPITLLGSGLTARDFAAPPPYSPPAAGAASLLPPPVPPTPPLQRLQRCVRKVVLIGRLGTRRNTVPEVDNGSRPKGATPQQCEVICTLAGLSAAARESSSLTGATSTSESATDGRDSSQPGAGAITMTATPSTHTLAAGEGTIPGNPTSTTVCLLQEN